ncbi:glycosyltransferase family 2 protein [Algibacter lectus]|nr:glycosyltransferase family 2 protein [Algibacter lectus]
MRKGNNAVRNKKLELQPCSHRVIIPLYIPNEDGYYQDAFNIFKMCLLSVQKTSISPLKISVISNGCCDEVNKKLFDLHQKNNIDELIIEKESIGKINSILKALRTAEERLITITDADVLFLNDWEDQILKVFSAFPKAGMVSPVPIFRTQYRHTSNIWFDYLFSNKLQFRPVKNPDALTKFANSIGWSYLNEKVKDVIASIIAKDGTLAVIGNSHFVGTYKSEVFKALPKQESNYRLGGTSEELYTDLPVLKVGGYRLATYDNYAYHLGNTYEKWMQDEFDSLQEEIKKNQDFKHLKALKINTLKYFLIHRVFKKILYNNKVKKVLFKQKGLSNKQLKQFMDGAY